MKKFLLAAFTIFGVCGWTSAQENPKDLLILAAVCSTHSDLNPIVVREDKTSDDELVYMQPSLGVARYTARFNETNKNRIHITDGNLKSTVTLLRKEGKLTGLRLSEPPVTHTYSIEQPNPGQYTLLMTDVDHQAPCDVWLKDGTLVKVRDYQKNPSPLKLTPVPLNDFDYSREGQTCRVIKTRYQKGDLKKGVATEHLFLLTDDLVRHETPQIEYSKESVLRSDGQLLSSVEESKYASVKTECDYDEQGRLIHSESAEYRKTSGVTVDVEKSFEFMGDSLFRQTVKTINSNPRADSQIKITVNFDKPGADPSAMEEHEYKEGTYVLTPEGELTQVIQPVGEDEKELFAPWKQKTRYKKDGVWVGWVAYQLRY